MNKIKTGLASFGMSGQVFHAPFINIHPQFQLTAINERSRNLAKEWYPETIIVRTIDDLLAIEELDLIVINTPDPTHYEYTRKALEAGKHVIVEKPFTETVTQGQELIDLAAEKELLLCVYQNRRWDADYLTVKEILECGKIGRIVEFESTFARFRNFIQFNNWKEKAGGMTYNLGSHLIDQCLQLFGMPEAVFADIAVMRTDGEVDDYFIIHLLRPEKNPNVRITLKASYLMCEPEPRYIIHGTDGSYIKYGVDKQEELLKQGVTPDSTEWGIETEEEWGWLHRCRDGKTERYKYPSQRGNYVGFYEAVYLRLHHNIPIETDARNVLPVIRIIEAAKESSRIGQVVKI